MFEIYCLYNRTNGKCYVGRTKYNVQRRFLDHCCSKSLIGTAIKSHGRKAFILSVIDTAITLEESNYKEQFWIKKLDSRAPTGYNLTDGGEGVLNPTQKSREAVSESNRRRLAVPGEQEKMQAARKAAGLSSAIGRATAARNKTVEQRSAVSRALKNVPKSAEHIAKVWEARRRNGPTEKEQKRLKRLGFIWMGRKHKESTKQAMREAWKRRRQLAAAEMQL